MSKHPAATREHHDEFCEGEGWSIVRGATGRPVSHHRTYELTLWDGRILRTRISKPLDKSTYSPSMWSHILREQLEVTVDIFWACVRKGRLPDRGAPKNQCADNALPLYLIRALSELGVDEASILTLTPGEAANLLAVKLTEQQNRG
ncbi:cytotoxic translational repressor of toxin-antitoxin stability system [Cryobacterium sp. TMT1-2-1]|nr:cytotoxic translational repressor of toxin-antitoxin stability system [Cryobacterium sp. TMT1-2-1]TFD90597.1 cytotoxic translational repressor of toxin-antitoxin stability system [Cryobacterium psychrotolerans]